MVLGPAVGPHRAARLARPRERRDRAADAARYGVDRPARGPAGALYFSIYYVAGSLGGYLPGLAFERWEWPGVAVLALGAYAVGFAAVALIGRRAA